jgi:hypothetical protein
MKEILYKKSFIDHNRRVQYEIANDRLLIMDILGGDGWPALCGFLGRPIPDEPFPFLHTAESVSAGNVSRPATYRLTT